MLLFLDGMAHYDSSQIGVKYTAVESAFAVWSIVPEGRFGNCLKRVATNNNSTTPLAHVAVAPFATRAGIWAPTTSGVCGFALKIDDLARVGPYTNFYEPVDLFAVIEGAHHHLKVAINANGTFRLSGYQHDIGGATLTLAESIEGMQSNAWAYLEFKWVIDKVVGTFEMRVNTIPVMTFTGDTFQDSGVILLPGNWNTVSLLGTPSTPAPFLTMRMCDLYLADLTGSGGDVRDFLGDGVVSTIFPNGPGLAAGWTPEPAAANWDNVNDKPAPDGDTTYVRTVSPGTRDVHQFEDIPVGATILGVHYNMLVRKEDEGSVTVKPIVGQGSTQYDGPTQGVGSLAYDRYLTQPYDLNPATGAPWTAAEINAGQWGILKVT